MVGDRTKWSEQLCNIVGSYKEAEQLAKGIYKVTKLFCVTCLDGELFKMKQIVTTQLATKNLPTLLGNEMSEGFNTQYKFLKFDIHYTWI